MKPRPQILTGNQAIACAAFDSGVALGIGYPGTPSTEVLETLGGLDAARAQWATNEKVALEVAFGVAISGRRAIVTMKHVGLNVAADPLFTASYTGIDGGLVVMVADDPGMHSSQNEQDSRHYAEAAKLPMLEPADSQEAYDFTRLAFELSERFDTPVLIRTTTRISHSKGIVTRGKADSPKREVSPPDDVAKYVMLPVNARKRHVVVEERMDRLGAWVEESEITGLDESDGYASERSSGPVGRPDGVITSGASYQYVREVAPGLSVLKLGMVWPLPIDAIRRFAASVRQLYVVEELDPFIETHLRAEGIALVGKERFPILGELSPALVAEGLGMYLETSGGWADLAPRPPTMCAGCPHRGVFWVLKKLGLTVAGDIGCYTLGASPPLGSMDTCVCMGAAVGVARGIEKAGVGPSKVVGVIGDSTFLHSGITGLLDMVYNGSEGTLLILDNGTTAMTGRQEHPGTGRNLAGEPAPKVDLEALVRSLGVEDVAVVDPYDMSAFEAAVRRALANRGPSVVIARHPCMLIPQEPGAKLCVDSTACNACGLCLKLGCPAMSKVEVERGGKPRVMPRIDPLQCTGCGVCAALCKREALVPEAPADTGSPDPGGAKKGKESR
ncbi:MAG: indolepyruvate ferredoxin oxidoreductase subunit alpha [Actinobacteria bacterium]|nr:MAG: indolepyruvate ferredoxin oxidoreductase subunit alpha [Actinomycetota bacterium]